MSGHRKWAEIRAERGLTSRYVKAYDEGMVERSPELTLDESLEYLRKVGHSLTAKNIEREVASQAEAMEALGRRVERAAILEAQAPLIAKLKAEGGMVAIWAAQLEEVTLDV